jgi:hypothetical protein
MGLYPLVVEKPFGLPRDAFVGLVGALTLFVSGYWSLHLAFYGPNGHVGPTTADRSTHSHNPEQPHGPGTEGDIGAPPTRATDVVE